MRVILLSCLLQTFFAFTLSGQDCQPSSPITLATSQLSEQSLRALVEAKRLKYTSAEMQAELQKIRQCNNQLEIGLSEVENEISAYSLRAQELYRFKDVSALKARLKTLETSLEGAKQELENNIAQVAQAGVYVVVLENIDPYDNKNELVKKAQTALHPFAIEDLNGVSIKRMTSISNFQSVKDIIESFVSGEASDKKVFVDKQNFAREYFLYVVQASVTPLKSRNFQGQNTTLSNDAFVMKLRNNFQSELLKKNISDEHIELIRDNALPYVKISADDNKNSQFRQRHIIEKSEQEIRKIQDDIEEVKRLIRDRSERIQAICNEYQLEFNPNNLDASAQRAFDHFQRKVQELDNDWTALKEQEIIPKETITTIEGSPAASTATESMKLYKTLNEQAGKISKTQERVRIEDFEVTDYEAKKDITLYRKIERIWVYPVPQDGNTFKVFIFGKFGITAKKNKFYDEVDVEQALKDSIGGLFGSSSGNNTGKEDNQDYTYRNSSATKRTGISTGMGGGLSGRGVGSKSGLTNNSEKEGQVTVKICVDSRGNVMSANFTQGGSFGAAASDATIRSRAIANAKKWKFDRNPSLDKQCGTITYKFKLR